MDVDPDELVSPEEHERFLGAFMSAQGALVDRHKDEFLMLLNEELAHIGMGPIDGHISLIMEEEGEA